MITEWLVDSMITLTANRPVHGCRSHSLVARLEIAKSQSRSLRKLICATVCKHTPRENYEDTLAFACDPEHTKRDLRRKGKTGHMGRITASHASGARQLGRVHGAVVALCHRQLKYNKPYHYIELCSFGSTGARAVNRKVCTDTPRRLLFLHRDVMAFAGK